MTAPKKQAPSPPQPEPPREVSPELRARIDHFAKAMGHLLLMKVNPEAARQAAAAER